MLHVAACTVAIALLIADVAALGGASKRMPIKIYNGWFDGSLERLSVQAVGRATKAGQRQIEVSFPSVPNLEEVDFGTPLNKKFGADVAKQLGVPGGYKPASLVSRNQIAFGNVFWARSIGSGIGGGILGIGGGDVNLLTTVDPSNVPKKGNLKFYSPRGRPPCVGRPGVLINPGPSDNWERAAATVTGGKGSVVVVLNPAVNDSYGIGTNLRGWESAFVLKRISKGWIYRSFPGPWCAYLETPTGDTELILESADKPELRTMAKAVREESFKRYAMFNDRYMGGKV